MENGSTISPPAAVASCPPWVMLNHYGYHPQSIAAETKTTAAAACTSTNLLFHVSLLLAAPPANSWLHYGWWESSSISQDDEGEESNAPLSSVAVIAAHGGALLLKVNPSDKRGSYYCETRTWDYFLYETAGTVRPPSLLKLPGCFPCWYDPDNESLRVMSTTDTGLLRCGGGDDEHLLVAQLEVSVSDDQPRDTADLCVLRVGQEWELKRAVPILFGGHPGSTSNAAIPRRWKADTVVPIGDRYLCWVDYLLGFLFCDMAADDASFKLRYVTLPVVPPKDVEYWDGRPYMRYCREMAGAGAGAVRFVNIEPRCCCGGHGRSTCARGQFSFTMTTWTLSLSMDEPLQWVKEGVLDCNELWALPAYKGLPQVTVKFPVVSLDNADVIWFVVLEDVQDYAKFADMRVWMIEVDTRNKALLSIVPYKDSCWRRERYITVKLS